MAVEKISRALGILPSHKAGFQKSCRSRNGRTVWKSKDVTLQANIKDCSLHDATNENEIKREGNESHWSVPVRSGSFNSTYIWMLDAEDLADIEDAAEWRHKNIEGVCVVEPASSLMCSASCCGKDIFGLRTSICWQQRCASAALTYCGHSFCSAGTALRTIQALPGSSALSKHASRTSRQSEGKDLADSGSAKSDQGTARVLQFLSLSGCYQITDRGLRYVVPLGSLRQTTSIVLFCKYKAQIHVLLLFNDYTPFFKQLADESALAA